MKKQNEAGAPPEIGPEPADHTIEKSLQPRTVEHKNFEFDPQTGNVRWLDGGETPYRLVVDGLVDKGAAFSYEDLKKFEQTRQVSDFHCVEGWSVLDLEWEGFRFSEILSRITIRPEAGFVVLHAMGETDYVAQGLNHYIESFAVADLLDHGKEILFALRLGGRPLARANGGPLRLVSPRELAYKSIKFVSRIEMTKRPTEGWWTIANPIYPMHAPVPAGRLRKKK
ncbi:MAG: molybdopterin-dependent oxidoreductase [Pseudomonadota bacterium]